MFILLSRQCCQALLIHTIVHKWYENAQDLESAEPDYKTLCQTYSPLMMAAETGRVEMVEELIKMGASVGFKNKVFVSAKGAERAKLTLR